MACLHFVFYRQSAAEREDRKYRLIATFQSKSMVLADNQVCAQYAKIMGMSTQLNLVGDDYSNASAAFFISSLIFSLPNIWLLNRMPVGKCLSVNIIGWGICNACHAALTNYTGLVTLRVLCGAFEAGVTPTLILIVSQYFRYEEQPFRMALWYSGSECHSFWFSFVWSRLQATCPLFPRSKGIQNQET